MSRSIAAALVATLVVLYLRDRQSFVDPQFWAEDGREFFVGQKLYGLDALVLPYSGYLHLIPRLTALLAAPFGAGVAPALFAVSSILVTAWSACTIATAAMPFAWLLGAMLVLPPCSGEVFGNITNIQWMMAPALAVILVTPTPRERSVRINQRVFAVAATFTGPFSIIVLPLALWRAWLERADRHGRVLSILILAGAVTQGSLILVSRGPAVPAIAAVHLAHAVLDRWIGQLAHGDLTTTPLHYAQNALVLAGVAPVLFFRRAVPLKLLVFCMLLLVVVWYRFLDAPRDSFDDLVGNDRYFFVPRLIVLWLLVVVALRARWFSLIAVAALGLIAANDTSWTRPDLMKLPWRSQAWRIDRGEAVRIVINPSTADAPDAWTVTLPARPDRLSGVGDRQNRNTLPAFTPGSDWIRASAAAGTSPSISTSAMAEPPG